MQISKMDAHWQDWEGIANFLHDLHWGGWNDMLVKVQRLAYLTALRCFLWLHASRPAWHQALTTGDLPWSQYFGNLFCIDESDESSHNTISHISKLEWYGQTLLQSVLEGQMLFRAHQQQTPLRQGYTKAAMSMPCPHTYPAHPKQATCWVCG